MQVSTDRRCFEPIAGYAILGLSLIQSGILICLLLRTSSDAPTPPAAITNDQNIPVNRPPSVEPLVEAARTAFHENHQEQGVAYLSAALAMQPNHSAALDLYRDRLKLQFHAAVDGPEKDWELAESQVAAYDAAVRSALAGRVTVSEVDELLRRLDESKSLLAELHSSVQNELKKIEAVVENLSASEVDVEAAYIGLRNLPTARVPDKVVSQIFDLVARATTRREEFARQRLQSQLLALEQQSHAENLKIDALQDLRHRANTVQSQLAKLEIDHEETAQLLSQSTKLCEQLDSLVQISSLRETRRLADGEALKALGEARRLLATGQAEAESERLQPAGEMFAQAELILGSIDRLSSLDVQREARETGEALRREALNVRSRQEQRYNLWAIDRLQESLADYQKALGIFLNDKEGFKRTLREKVGVIDTQVLHPATHALYQEMFQKLYGGLGNEDRVEITRIIELTKKVRLTDESTFNSSN